MTVSIPLGSVPIELSQELFDKYREIEKNFRERRWEPSELNGGKLCEVTYVILRGYIDGSYPTSVSKPSNFLAACQQLEQSPTTIARAVRIQIPRVLVALYEVRNNRGVGHVGGDVNPNHMDSLLVLHMAKWVVSEMVRVFHNISTDEATDLVEAISDRTMPLIWNTGTVERVLNNNLSMLQKTLALLYSSPGWVSEKHVFDSLEHSNASVFRRDVLKKAHKNRLLEYNQQKKQLKISPLGLAKFEDEVLSAD